MNFEPKVLSFLCNWCAYAGADLAGISRFQYPPNTRTIRVMCSGRVDPAFIPRALLAGFDGVMVLGCHIGDCHYLQGNIQAKQKMELVQKLLREAEVEEERLYFDYVSAGEGQRFAKLVADYVERIRPLGPALKSKEIKEKLQALINSLEGEKIRWVIGKIPYLKENENVYGERVATHRLEEILDRTLKDELNKNRIIVSLTEGPKTAKDLSAALNLPLSEILSCLTALLGEGRVAFETSHEDVAPLFSLGV